MSIVYVDGNLIVIYGFERIHYIIRIEHYLYLFTGVLDRHLILRFTYLARC